MRVEITRSQLYNELTSDLKKELFSYTHNKFLHGLDNLYYNVFIEDDKNENDDLVSFFYLLDELKEKVLDKTNKDSVTCYDLNVELGTYANIYNYRLSEPDKFDIYIAGYLPNLKTSRIVVQLRAEGLWLYGTEELLEESFNKIADILEIYNCDIIRTLENRFDYAYHTNSIQSPFKMFRHDSLKKRVKTTLNRYTMIGVFDEQEEDKMTIDYFALGSRRSQTLFTRIYNKTREVVELGYKSFFIDMWYKHKLINFYDKYCLEFAYKKKRYSSIHEARLNFYLEYGSDNNVKSEIKLLLKDKNSRYYDYRELADLITPQVTIIINIEFETKRKFYYYADEQIEVLPCVCKTKELSRIYKIYQNRNIFLDYITSESFSFVKNDDYMGWWKRLRNLKLTDCNYLDKEYLRSYSSKVDFEKSLSRTLNSMAVTSLYKNNIETDFIEDFSDMLGMINDNHIKNKTTIAFVDSNTGEVIDSIDNDIILKYNEYKQKKYRELKNRISSVSPDHKNS